MLNHVVHLLALFLSPIDWSLIDWSSIDALGHHPNLIPSFFIQTIDQAYLPDYYSTSLAEDSFWLYFFLWIRTKTITPTSNKANAP